MKPQEKAKELIALFIQEQQIYDQDTEEENRKYELYFARRCAVSCVQEILTAIMQFGYVVTFYDDFETNKMVDTCEQSPCDYWEEVKKELNKII